MRKVKPMNISNETLDVLRNFSSINSGLTVNVGNELKTVSAMKNIFAKAIVPEVFEKDPEVLEKMLLQISNIRFLIKVYNISFLAILKS